MDFEPVLFDNAMFETANESFVFCKEHLEKKGHAAATALQGLAPINSNLVGHLALQALQTAKASVSDDSARYLEIAISAMRRALHERHPARDMA